jgi:hypothetical protein
LFDATVTDGSFTASTGLFTTTVLSGITICWLHSILLMDWLRILVMLYVPLGIGCNGYYSVSINAQWSVVNGVTLVLVVVAAMPLNVSFVNAFNAVTTVLFDATVTDGSFASTGLFTTKLWL